MSLFRINPEEPFQGPHQNQPVGASGTDLASAKAGVILVHGRGASADSMLDFAKEFHHPDVHYRAIQAKNHTWYPRSFMAPQEEMNEPGISSGLQAIYKQISELNAAGISTDNINLLGFSQGACLATEFAARHPQQYGGIVGLSGGLIGEKVYAENYSGSLEQTPVFLGCSDRDPHIPKKRVDKTEEIFEQLEGDVMKKIYEGMGHTVNPDEIQYVNNMLSSI